MPIIDITPALSSQTPVFPGDTPFVAARTWSMDSSPVNVSKIVMSTHAGAHADAPLHYAEGAPAIDEVSLEAYIGPCCVIHLIGARGIIDRKMLEAAASRISSALAPRVLIRTYAKQPLEWDGAFAAIGADAIHWLAEKGCILIGVDTPSLDPETSKSMDAHMAILGREMRVLEGLMLDDAPEGLYELIAPPLKLRGLDAAPVRALLRTL